MKSLNKTLFVLMILHLLQISAFCQSVEQLEYLDQYYQKSFDEWKIPGMAIALVKDDKIIYEKGFGFAHLNDKTPVDPHTLFAVASNTKSFTASAIGMLVEQGRIAWKDKVKKHLPWFEMDDDWVEKEMTIEDLLCHRSGLKTFSGDLLWYGSDKNAREVVESAKALKASKDFRADYGYSNIMYIAAGLVVESVTDSSFEAFIQHHFLNPLEMSRTQTSVSSLSKTENVASPYYLENGKYIELEWLNWDNVLAAGGLISSVRDMSNWLILNLNRGTYKGNEFFTDQTFEKLSTPHINFMVNRYTRENQPSKHFRGYGLGWSVGDHHGRKIISHGGGYDGMISKTCVVPEEGIGMVILTNSLNYLPSALMEKTMDVLLGDLEEGPDYSSMYLQSANFNQEKKEKISQVFEESREERNPNIPLEEFTGTFRDNMYGDIKVRLENGYLYFEMKATPIFQARLEYWKGNVFTFRFNPKVSSLPPGKLWFEKDKNNQVSKLYIDIENPDFDFMEFEFVKLQDN